MGMLLSAIMGTAIHKIFPHFSQSAPWLQNKPGPQNNLCLKWNFAFLILTLKELIKITLVKNKILNEKF